MGIWDDLKKKGTEEVGALTDSVWKKGKEIALKGVEESVSKVLGTKFTQNEDGTISRDVKISGQKVQMTVFNNNGVFYIPHDGYSDLAEEHKNKLLQKYEEQGAKKLSKDEQVWLKHKDSIMMAQAVMAVKGETAAAEFMASFSDKEILGKEAPSEYTFDLSKFTETERAEILKAYSAKMKEAYGEELGTKHFETVLKRSGVEYAHTAENTAENTVEDAVLFAKEALWHCDRPNATKRDLEVLGKTVTVDVLSFEGKHYIPTGTLQDSDMKRIAEKGESELSNTERVCLAATDALCLARVVRDMDDDLKGKDFLVGFTEEELNGKKAPESYKINKEALAQFDSKKQAKILGAYCDNLREVYGEEVGVQRFKEILERSGIKCDMEYKHSKSVILNYKKTVVSNLQFENGNTNEVVVEQTSAKASVAEVEEKSSTVASTSARTVETEAPEVPVSEEMTKDAAEARIDEKTAVREASRPSDKSVTRVDVVEAMKTEEAQKLQKLLNRRGVKVQNPDDTMTKLIEKYGPEMAYDIALKCVIEPKNAMGAMDEGFKTSGQALEYFAELDVSNEENRAKVEAMTGKELPAVETRRAISRDGIENVPPAAINVEPTVKPDMANMPKPKSPAELSYDMKLAEKRKKDPEATGLTLGDLKKMGVSMSHQNLSDVLVSMGVTAEEAGKQLQNELIPNGLPNEDAVVSKEYAVALIAKAQRDMCAAKQRQHDGR